MIGLSEIAVSFDRMRGLRPDNVDELAESISERGLLHPITARGAGIY
jgi:ParB-like chromosome segregation protein Spo0J